MNKKVYKFVDMWLFEGWGGGWDHDMKSFIKSNFITHKAKSDLGFFNPKLKPFLFSTMSHALIKIKVAKD